MITKCKKCGTIPYISPTDEQKLRVSTKSTESVTIICPNCDEAWDDKIQTDHGISNRMSEDLHDQV